MNCWKSINTTGGVCPWCIGERCCLTNYQSRVSVLLLQTNVTSSAQTRCHFLLWYRLWSFPHHAGPEQDVRFYPFLIWIWGYHPHALECCERCVTRVITLSWHPFIFLSRVHWKTPRPRFTWQCYGIYLWWRWTNIQPLPLWVPLNDS